MKHLMVLNQEYILETQFRVTHVKDEKGNNYPDWVDDKKQKANGIQLVEHVTLLVMIPDREGYNSSTFQKVWINKEDILKLSEKIKELDGVKLVGYPGDDLPF